MCEMLQKLRSFLRVCFRSFVFHPLWSHQLCELACSLMVLWWKKGLLLLENTPNNPSRFKCIPPWPRCVVNNLKRSLSPETFQSFKWVWRHEQLSPHFQNYECSFCSGTQLSLRSPELCFQIHPPTSYTEDSTALHWSAAPLIRTPPPKADSFTFYGYWRLPSSIIGGRGGRVYVESFLPVFFFSFLFRSLHLAFFSVLCSHLMNIKCGVPAMRLVAATAEGLNH